MRPTMLGLAVSTSVALLALGCGSGGRTNGKTPLNHRPSDAQCSTAAAPGNCTAPLPIGVQGGSSGGCAIDNDCTGGTNGRCITPGGGVRLASDPACVCTYDACMRDTDCPSGQTCACRGCPYIQYEGNTCVSGNCRVDADCGAGGYCSPSPVSGGWCGNDLLAGYYCHTARDLCIDDSDCTTKTVPGLPVCAYSTTDTRWECFSVDVCL